MGPRTLRRAGTPGLGPPRAEEDQRTLDDYTEMTGVPCLATSLELYRPWWDLTEISLCLGLFRQPHRETADTSLAWDGFNRYLHVRCLNSPRA